MFGLDFYGGKDLLKRTLTHREPHLSVERDNLAVLLSVFLLLATWDEVSNLTLAGKHQCFRGCLK